MTGNTGLIIFSRHDSVRLPGKALMPIAGRPLLGHVIDRTRLVATKALAVVATSDRPEDDAIAAFASQEGAAVFRGDLRDVAGRALACCRAHGFDRFARICGDRPFLDPGLIDTLLQRQMAEDLDLATNVQRRTYPAGLATEIVATRALKHVIGATEDPEDREHLTRYIYRQSQRFSIYNLSSTDLDYSDVNLALDTERDLQRCAWIAAQAEKSELLGWQDAARMAREWDAQRHSKS